MTERQPGAPRPDRLEQELVERDPHVWAALEAIQAELDRRPLPEGFSAQAKARLLDRQSEYLEDLGIEAVRVARHAGNAEVQPVNVDRADEIVRSERESVRQGLLTFGGLLWGAAISVFVQELAEKNPRWLLVAVAGAVLVAATVMLMSGRRGRR